MSLGRIIAMGIARKVAGPTVDKDDTHSYMKNPDEQYRDEQEYEELYNSPYFDKLVMYEEKLRYCADDPEKCAKIKFKIHKLQHKIMDMMEIKESYGDGPRESHNPGNDY